MSLENLGFNLSIPGDGDEEKTKVTEYLAPKKITKYSLLNWIKKSGLDDETKAALSLRLAKYPTNTMHHFFVNIHKHIQTIHSERAKKTKD